VAKFSVPLHSVRPSGASVKREHLGRPTNELHFTYVATDESELSFSLYPEDCGL